MAKEKKILQHYTLPSIWDQESSEENAATQREPQELLLVVLPEDAKDKVGGL